MFATIKRLIAQETTLEARLEISAAELTPDADLYELGLTSPDAMRLLAAIEREFVVKFPRNERLAIASVEAIALAVLSLWQLELESRKERRTAA
jgi:acyl carrier protein